MGVEKLEKKPSAESSNVQSFTSPQKIMIGGDSMTAEEICKSVDARIRPQAVVLAEQMLFMAEKLDQTREDLTYQPIAIPYDNGGGQTGIRENPVFAAYEKLLSSYTKTISALSAMIGEKGEAEQSALADLRSRFKVVAGG